MRKQLTKTRLSIAIAGALFMTQTVLAAEEGTAKEKVESLEEIEVIEVSGTRASITSSLNSKRYANSVMDAITADDIGSFPDSNVAESLQRMPGISITRSLSGQGEQVSIRGFSPGKNVTLVNGQQMMTSGFQLENALNRGFNFGVLPAEVVQRTEVYKSSEAHLVEGGVGGTVNIVTRKPLNQKDKTLFKVSGAGSYNSLSEETSPIVSTLASWQNDEKTFGVLASYDYFSQDSRRDAVEVLQYRKYNVTTQSDGVTYPGALVPVIAGGANFNQELERNTAMVTFQYKPVESIDMSLSVLDSTLDGDNLNVGLLSQNHLANHATDVESGTYNPETNTFEEITYNQISKAHQSSGWVNALSRESSLENTSVNFDIKWTGDNLVLDFAMGASESSGGAGKFDIIRTRVGGGSTVSIADGVGNVQYPDVDPTNLDSALTWGFAGNQERTTETDSDFVAVDAEYFFDDSFVQSVMVGARVTETTIENRHFGPSAPNFNALFRDTVTAGEMGDLQPIVGDFLDGFDNSAVSDFEYLHPADAKAYMEENGLTYQNRIHTGNTWDIEEDITSFYLQANFLQEFDLFSLRGNVGVRTSDQDTTTWNFANGGVWANVDNYDIEFDDKRKGSTSETLPSVNLIFDFENDWVIRTAYSTVISRPTYNELARKLTYSDPEESGQYVASKGNADLDPFEADKFDLSTEWYYAEGSSISLGLFYYDVATYVINDTTTEDLFNDGNEWVVTQPVNIDGGSIEGYEFAFTHQFSSLPAPFDGLGITANYTRIESDNDQDDQVDPEGNPLPMPGLSEDTYNAVFFYSKGSWDARLSYNYRDSYYEQVVLGLPRYNDGTERLDMKVKYKVSDNLGLYVQGTNLTDDESERYIGEPSRPFQTSIVGTNYVAGFNYTF